MAGIVSLPRLSANQTERVTNLGELFTGSERLILKLSNLKAHIGAQPLGFIKKARAACPDRGPVGKMLIVQTCLLKRLRKVQSARPCSPCGECPIKSILGIFQARPIFFQ